jgi:hypothetical protein
MIPVLQVAMIFWGRAVLRRWRLHPQTRPHSQLKTALTILLPSLLNLLAALFLLMALPKGIGHPLVLLLMVAPDFGAFILIGGILGIILGLAWPLLAIPEVRRAEKSNDLAAPLDSMGFPTGE